MAKISTLPFRLKGSIQSVEEFIMLPMVINVCLNFKTATKIQKSIYWGSIRTNHKWQTSSRKFSQGRLFRELFLSLVHFAWSIWFSSCSTKLFQIWRHKVLQIAINISTKTQLCLQFFSKIYSQKYEAFFELQMCFQVIYTVWKNVCFH